jgi:formylglycine-generating enzyme required for sulfatase activity
MQRSGRLEGTATRGASRNEIILQEPLAKLPEKDFDLLDRYLDPGEVRISAASEGSVLVEGAPGAAQRIRPGASISRKLPEKAYVVTMLYADGKRDVFPVEVQNNGVYEVRFEYKAPPPVIRPSPMPDNFVRIPGGTFTMGSPANEAGREDREGPQHQVTVSGFYMGKYEVTQAEYEAVMGTNPSNFKGPKLPVEKVSWFDAVEYCNKRSQREGLSPAYTISGSGASRSASWNRSANGYRLPTEAEWEYACRAGTTGPYSSGNSVDNAGWYYSISGKQTQTVGSKQANSFGLYDMHGNVVEWCWDWYGSYSNGSQTDPVGASSGAHRVYRGASWFYEAQSLRSARRFFNAPVYRFYDIGFRLVRQ